MSTRSDMSVVGQRKPAARAGSARCVPCDRGRSFPNRVASTKGLVLTAQKRLSNQLSLLANYTYARMLGNYPGTYDGVVDENLPNFFVAVRLCKTR